MRPLKDLLALAEALRQRGIGLVVLKQQIDTTTPRGRLVFHLLGALDEFQREVIVEGTNQGLAAAPRPRPGRRTQAQPHPGEIDHARKLYADGKHTVAQIAGLLGVSRQTIYRALEPEAVARPACGVTHVPAPLAARPDPSRTGYGVPGDERSADVRWFAPRARHSRRSA